MDWGHTTIINAKTHRDFLAISGLQMLTHPQHSPDLSPSSGYRSPHIKKTHTLKNKRSKHSDNSHSNTELKKVILVMSLKYIPVTQCILCLSF